MTNKIRVEISHIDGERTTQFGFESIQDMYDNVQSKLEEYHTLGQFEIDYYMAKGKLDSERKTGWYLQETECQTTNLDSV